MGRRRFGGYLSVATTSTRSNVKVFSVSPGAKPIFSMIQARGWRNEVLSATNGERLLSVPYAED